jgi:sugar lactone lactonase YvrE
LAPIPTSNSYLSGAHLAGRAVVKAWGRTLALLLAGTSFFVHSQTQLQVGYTVVTADPGTSLPVGVALFSYINAAGVLISQAGVGAVQPALSGRIFVDESGTQTGIALANPSPQRASATLVLRDSSGREVERKEQRLEAGEHTAQYVRQLFPILAAGFAGSLAFQSDTGLAAITLRESRNGRGEPLYTTLPVVAAGVSDSLPAVFSQVAAGQGYRTQLILLNTTAQTQRGKARFVSSDGTDLALSFGGVSASEFLYEIAAQGTYRAEFDKPGALGVGYAIVTPDVGNTTPSGTAVFRYMQGNSLITEAGVGAVAATSSARIFVDNAATYTGVAIANSGAQSAAVTFSLLDRYGTVLDTTTRTLPAKNHTALFAHQLFPGLNNSFTGLMEIRSTAACSVVTLRQTDNSRGEQVLTTLPVADMTAPPAASSMTFPHVASGDGFSTRLIFINGSASTSAAGALTFFQSNGTRMLTSLGGRSGSEFSYSIPEGGGKQLLPGNSAKVAAIDLVDPVSSKTVREVVVNEGSRLRVSVRVRDSAAVVRDDFDLSYRTLDANVASVDATGSIEAKKAGFSTVTIDSGGVIATGTITVVKIDAGTAGFDVTGIAQDLSRRLYLAITSDHTILRAEGITQAPLLYAGVAKTGGLKNDARLQSWFRNPAFLALDQSDGALYVADTANHAIRKISPGPSGSVETLAGGSEAGSRDGPSKEATFRSPQGVQLDGRGNLWVVDSGNHTIRRIRLATGMVETIAGKAGVAGWVDGARDQARFSSPRGIALETESLAERLDRERRGDPPPPVALLVADTANGVIRRIGETGEVQTIRSDVASTALRSGSAEPSAPLLFDSPEGIAVDPSGNVFVTEPGSGLVRTILHGGEVVAAAQARTFKGPKGLAIGQAGKVVVAESAVFAREIAYGEPAITSITPSHVGGKGGAAVTIKGRNFAPGTRLAIAGVLIVDARIADTSTITATVPALPSGNGTVTVENRGGVAQAALLVDAVPLSQLSPGQITTVAGGTTYSGDGGASGAAALSDPDDVFVDPFGDLFIADTYNHRIRKVAAATGVITTVAGTGIQGFSGDGDDGILGQLAAPAAVALDSAGNILIADTLNNRIRKVDATTGIITTVAGGDRPGYSGDGGPATAALLNNPLDVALDAAGNIFVADTFNHRIRKIAAATGLITTVAGTGVLGFSGDGSAATLARLWQPQGMAFDGSSYLFIADTGNHVVRKVDLTTGIITTVAGSGQPGYGGDNGPAIACRFSSPHKIALDSDRNLLIADQFNSRIRKFSPASGIITTVAGTGAVGFAGDGGQATAAWFTYAGGVGVDASGNVIVVDTYNDRIRRVSTTGVIRTLVGIGQTTPLGDGGPATAATLDAPEGLALDASGNLIVADSRHNKIRKVDAATGTISTIAGTGQKGYAGDGGAATAAYLRVPTDVSLDPSGNVFILDSLSHAVRKLTSSTGTITTVAGGLFGSGGDDGPASKAQFNNASAVVVDSDGTYFVADTQNHRVRRIDGRTGIITTAAGTGTAGFSGDNGPASAAQLSYPTGVAVDAGGNLLIADSVNSRIRKVSAATGIITTAAGSGFGTSGDNGPATAARFSGPRRVIADSAGNLFIADSSNNRVRRVDAVTGIVTTVAGTGQAGFAGDGGAATAAQLRQPVGLVLGSDGTLFVADRNNFRVRAIRGPVR